MAVDRVVLEAQRRQLGQEVLGEAGVDEEPQPGRRAVDDDQLVELVADPLGRHDLQARGPRSTTAATSSGTGSRPKPAMNRAARSIRSGSSSKLISGRQRRAQRRRRQVGGAAVRVDQRDVDAGVAGQQLERHRVDREVAPRQVGLDVVGERDVRLARVVGVAPRRGTS